LLDNHRIKKLQGNIVWSQTREAVVSQSLVREQ
jgi:hypothetical protein